MKHKPYAESKQQYEIGATKHQQEVGGITQSASVLEAQTHKLIELGQTIGKLTQQIYDLSVTTIGHGPPAPTMHAQQEPVTVPDSLVSATDYIGQQINDLQRTVNRFY